MKQKILILLLLMGSLSHVFAQVNFQPGYVVTQQGDTLKGFIDYRNWEKNPDAIVFRRSADEAPKEYRASGVRSFAVANDRYVSAFVKVEDSPMRVGMLEFNPEFVFHTDTVFLRVLVAGARSLYFYDERKEHFYIQQDGRFDLLMYKRYLRESSDGKKIITETNTYIGQLKAYLSGGCPGTEKALKRVAYNRASMEKVFAAYVGCNPKRVSFEAKADRQPSELGVLAGITLTTLSLNAEPRDLLMATSYDQSVNFTGGVFYDLMFRRNRGKWSVNNELIYTSYQASGYYAYSFHEYETRFEYSHTKLNTMARFKYPAGKMFLYVNAGISNGLVVRGSDFRRWTNNISTPPRVEEGKAFERTQRYELGYLLGVGAKVKKYSLEVRYAKSIGMVNTVGIGSSLTRISFVAGYRIR